MTRKLKFRPDARQDALRLAKHFADAPPEIGDELVRLIEAHADRLTRFPFMGRPLPHGSLRETTVIYGKSRYVIRYRVTDKLVQIVRIWHGRENRPR